MESERCNIFPWKWKLNSLKSTMILKHVFIPIIVIIIFKDPLAFYSPTAWAKKQSLEGNKLNWNCDFFTFLSFHLQSQVDCNHLPSTIKSDWMLKWNERKKMAENVYFKCIIIYQRLRVNTLLSTLKSKSHLFFSSIIKSFSLLPPHHHLM